MQVLQFYCKRGAILCKLQCRLFVNEGRGRSGGSCEGSVPKWEYGRFHFRRVHIIFCGFLGRTCGLANVPEICSTVVHVLHRANLTTDPGLGHYHILPASQGDDAYVRHKRGPTKYVLSMTTVCIEWTGDFAQARRNLWPLCCRKGWSFLLPRMHTIFCGLCL